MTTMKLNRRSGTFLLLQLSALSLFFTGPRFGLFAIVFCVQIFAISGGYHRYFTHRSYKTSRGFQFVLGLLGCLAGQRGPLWWASHHRFHHAHSDTELDVQSPRHRGMLYSHFGWILDEAQQTTRENLVEDLRQYPELIWLDRYALRIFCGFALLMGLLGGASVLAWGVIGPTLAVAHITMLTNSFMHADFGKQTYDTHDDTVNIPWMFFALGEQYHNNHHRFPHSASNAHHKGEVDVIFFSLRALRFLGLVWDLRMPPSPR